MMEWLLPLQKWFHVSRSLRFQRPYCLSNDNDRIFISYSSFNYYTNLIDCNIYFCKRLLLDKLQILNDISDFKV